MRLTVSAASFAAAIGAALLSGPAAAAPDRTQGMALMSAFVEQDGVLFGGSGAVSAERNGVGAYTVEFDRKIDGCVAVANSEGTLARLARVLRTASATALSVRTSRPDNLTALDARFRMLVFCAE